MKKLVSRFATYVFSVTAKMIFLQLTHTQDRKPRISVHKSQQKRWHILCPSNSLYKASDSEEFHESFMMTISNFFFPIFSFLYSQPSYPFFLCLFLLHFMSRRFCPFIFEASVKQWPAFCRFYWEGILTVFLFLHEAFLFRVWKKMQKLKSLIMACLFIHLFNFIFH